MDWLTTLRRSGGINALSRQIGASPAEVAAGTEALLPILLGGFREVADRLGAGDEGIRALVEELAAQGGGQLAIDVMSPEPLKTGPGYAILDLAIGPDVARRAVLMEAERSTGLDQTLGARVLPGLAMLVGGYIAARASSGDAAGGGGRLSELGTLLDTFEAQGSDRRVDRI